MKNKQKLTSRSDKKSRLGCCQGCRESHRKCDKNTPCRTCEERQIECVRGSRFKFKYTSTPIGKQKTAKPRLQRPASQGAIEICDETVSTALGYRNLDCAAFQFAPDLSPASPASPAPPPVSPPHSAPNTASLNEQRSPPARNSDFRSEIRSAAFDCHHPPTDWSSISNFADESSMTSDCRNPLSRREAALLRHFCQTIAPWLDVTDPGQHFASAVPCRALHSPVLRFAIFALAERHLSFMAGVDELESLRYHTKSVQLLIPALSSPHHSSDDLLAATVILRLFEEMDGPIDPTLKRLTHQLTSLSLDNDYQCHLSGITSMLALKPLAEKPSDLREATAWLYLRQDIYVSLVTQAAPRTNLEEFTRFYGATEDNDFGWAKRIVLLVARVLLHVTSDLPSSEKMISWYELDDLVEEWHLNKPSTFEPIYQSGHQSSDGHLSEIWTVSPVHVLGLQYYHIAKIALASSNPSSVTQATASLKRACAIDKYIRGHLLTIIGLAHSNRHAGNSLFTARHCLSAWGGALRNRKDRSMALEFLEIESNTQYMAKNLADTLRVLWDDDLDESVYP